MTVHKKAVRLQRDIRRALNNALDGKKAVFPFPVDACRGLSTTLKAIEQDGINGMIEVLINRDILTNNSKTVFSLDASIMNCSASRLCAKYCYHAKQLLIYREYCVKCVAVDIAVRRAPERVASAVIKQWNEAKDKPECLRVFGGGDFDNEGAYLRVIRLLNDAGIRCHIFSKKPEQLALCDARNIRLLSLDASNLKKALDNNLPCAVVYTQGLFKNPIFQQLQRAGRIQNVLPVQQYNGNSIAENVAELENAFPDIYPYLCPCDSNLDGIHSCRQCDNARDCNGRGCYHKHTTQTINFMRLEK